MQVHHGPSALNMRIAQSVNRDFAVSGKGQMLVREESNLVSHKTREESTHCIIASIPLDCGAA